MIDPKHYANVLSGVRNRGFKAGFGTSGGRSVVSSMSRWTGFSKETKAIKPAKTKVRAQVWRDPVNACWVALSKDGTKTLHDLKSDAERRAQS